MINFNSLHFYISLIKSILRIVAGVNLIYGNLLLAGIFLIIAEGFNLLEDSTALKIFLRK